MQNDTHNPFASAFTVLSSKEARQWYKTKTFLLMTKCWSGVQYLGLLVVNRIQIQMGPSPLTCPDPRSTPRA